MGVAEKLAIMSVAVVFSGVLVGKTGWGGWIVTGSVAWVLFPPVVVSGIAHPVSATLDLVLIFWALRRMSGRVNWSEVAAILIPSVPGALLGAYLLSVADHNILRLAAAALIFSALFPAVWNLAKYQVARPGLGFLSGALSSTGMFNGPPIAVALSGKERAGDFLATLGVVFIGVIIISAPALLLMMRGESWSELVDGFTVGALLAPLAAASTWISLKRSAGDQNTRARTWGRWVCLAAALIIVFQVAAT